MDAPVIIVGAGPVGLAAACALAHHDVRSVILESRAGPGSQSRAIAVLPRTQEILRGWGALAAFLDAGTYRQSLPLWIVGEPAPRVTIELSELADVCAVPGMLLVPQHTTEALLAEHLARSGLGEIRWGHRVEDVVQDADGVTVTSHRDGVKAPLRAGWVIGCDGAHSAVRERLGLGLGGHTFPRRFFLADVKLAQDRDLPWPRVVPLKSGVLAGIRIGPLWRIIATVPGADDLPGYVSALFGTERFEVVWKSGFQVHCRTSPRFHVGRVILAGDAAHLDSPAGGQGMNAGIQDVHNLGWKLARALRGGDADALLGSYDTERRGAIAVTHRWTTGLTRMATMPAPLRRVALALARRRFASAATRRRWLTRATMLDIRYHSALITGHGPLLGARVPDSILLRGHDPPVLLQDLASRGPLLLLFGEMPPGLRAGVADVPDLVVHDVAPIRVHPDTLVDPAGRVSAALHAHPGTALLVRPDGHVGWRQRRPTVASVRRGVRKALGEPEERVAKRR
jgi:2-polyprenyl-6-methoxyphenol hydroxylase-like FAD-dependent oxidoreductase